MENLENRLLLAGDGLTGHGAPSGPHYNLNIIGTTDKNMDGTNSSGHVIFVPLQGKTKILLAEGDEFAVLDKNGTDGQAKFQLPNPGLDPYEPGNPGDADTEADYSVYARPLGKPGGFSTITTCADVIESNLETFLSAQDAKVLNEAGELGGVCSLEQVGMDITLREKGKSSFENVTKELLTILLEIDVDEDGDGIVDDTLQLRVPIFNDILQNEYWEYDNSDLKLLQLRFYPIPTDLEGGNALDADLSTQLVEDLLLPSNNQTHDDLFTELGQSDDLANTDVAHVSDDFWRTTPTHSRLDLGSGADREAGQDEVESLDLRSSLEFDDFSAA